MTKDEIRAEIYLTLSEIFKPPTGEFLRSLARGEVERAVNGWLSLLGLDMRFPPPVREEGDVEAFVNKLGLEYHSQFTGPAPPFTPLAESVYKNWDSGGASVLGGAKGYFMGAPALDMKNRYDEAGVEIPGEYRHQPDHLALTLEYFSISLSRMDPGQQRAFADSHFNWLPDLLDEMNNSRRSRTYGDLLRFLMEFIERDKPVFMGV